MDELTVCDVCNGCGIDKEADGTPVECHLCDGAGHFDRNGFPACEQGDDDLT